ncbi:threonyl-tRNA synthetase [Niveomyces insectorum RCEF 264]|uniref:threonine--tRNA ligase n=1 Tax=Niveomyces insectorum RCEF 264 TaxID=1081102 RepID=A0A167VIV9_9HYPO|nr:threonyl-tRNA synthetase [Niveomyces insectorum RCEF 264]
MLASRRTAAAWRAPAAPLFLFQRASPRCATFFVSLPSSSPSCSSQRPVSFSLPSAISSSSSRRYCSSHGPQPQPQPQPQPSQLNDRQPPDHRSLGVQQELFTSSVYSPGSPIFLPNGARIFNRLVDFLRKQYAHYGFQEVITPTIYKKALWAKSGHLDNYADDMFTVTSRSLATGKQKGGAADDEVATTAATAAVGNDVATVEDEYGLKPMNCPGHCLIFAAQRRSYRDLPLRYADFSPLHRNELSGALTGLTRVRRFHQDDGHIFCRPDQVEAEIRATLGFVQRTYRVLGLGPYRLVLATRPTDGHLIGAAAEWDAAEAALRRALDSSGQAWTISPGDGAFYGPKIDVVLRDADGKEHQTATLQLDFQMPQRFGLTYQGPTSSSSSSSASSLSEEEGTTGAGLDTTPVLIHRAVLGSVERLLALLIEHYNGRWPFWLNPRQVAVLTVNDSDAVVGFARRVQALLAGTDTGTHDDASGDGLVFGGRTLLAAVDVDASPRTLPLKVREAKAKGYGAIVVVGPKDVARGTVAVDLSGTERTRSRGVTAAGGRDSSDNNSSSSSSSRKAKTKTTTVEMTPEALLELLQHKVNTYQ